ncbi:MAG: acyl-CoA dehydrogenase family protein, partial [Alphaproteobacteria bacterium]
MTEQEILNRADQVAAAIRGQSERIEEARRLPDDIADIIKASDLTRLFVPKQYGGMEAHPVTAFKAFEKVAAADASAGWCLGIVASPGINAAYMEDAAAQHFYGTPGAWMAGVFAPNGKAVQNGDSYKVNGRWSWGSGTQNADHVMGGCFVVGDDGKPIPPVVPRLMIVSREQIKFHDTWHVSGLKGTGSTDFEMVGLDVPVSHAVSLQADPRRLDAPLYIFPSFAMLATGIAATALGVGQAALEAFHDLAGAKMPQFSK